MISCVRAERVHAHVPFGVEFGDDVVGDERARQVVHARGVRRLRGARVHRGEAGALRADDGDIQQRGGGGRIDTTAPGDLDADRAIGPDRHVCGMLAGGDRFAGGALLSSRGGVSVPTSAPCST